MKTIDDLLDEARPAVPPLRPAARDRGAAVLQAALTVERGARRRRRWVRGGIAAAVAAAIVAAIPLVNVGGHHSGVDAEAATVLHHLADTAGRQPGGWPDAAFWYTKTSYVSDGQHVTRQIWVAHHGVSVLVDPGVDAGVIWLGTGVFTAGSVNLTWDQLYQLPTDPAQLEQALRADIQGAGPDDDSELFTIVGDLIRESPAPPALRRALFDVAAGLPGVHSLGSVTDALGRPAVGLERDGQVYDFDATTGALLQEDEGGGYVSTMITSGPATTAPHWTRR
jgi:hypothetical protein